VIFIIQNKPKTKKTLSSIKEQEKAVNMLLRFMTGLIIWGTHKYAVSHHNSTQ